MSAYRIISRRETLFEDRREAGRLVARELLGNKGDAVIVGIPRGGLLVAREIARILECPLDFILAQKIGAPENAECAVGAVAEKGVSSVDEALFNLIPQSYLDEEIRRQSADICRRSVAYRAHLAKLELAGRTVVITDDGAAMGQTMIAASVSVRREKPKRLVIALPVAPEKLVGRLSAQADEVVCLASPPGFEAVGQHYRRFAPVEETEVIKILDEERERRLLTLGEA